MYEWIITTEDPECGTYVSAFTGSVKQMCNMLLELIDDEAIFASEQGCVVRSKTSYRYDLIAELKNGGFCSAGRCENDPNDRDYISDTDIVSIRGSLVLNNRTINFVAHEKSKLDRVHSTKKDYDVTFLPAGAFSIKVQAFDEKEALEKARMQYDSMSALEKAQVMLENIELIADPDVECLGYSEEDD